MRGIARRAAFTLTLAMVGCGISPAPSVDLAACPAAAPTAGQATTILAKVGRAVVRTTMGSFTIELYPQKAPIAAANFVALARCGFYSEISFHRVLAGYIAQAGDPQTRSNHGIFDKLGAGGPGYHFKVELPDQSLAYDRYTVAMANAIQYDALTGEIQGGTDTNGSQFFIALDSLVGRLRPYYTIFGKVVEGTDVVDAIGLVSVNNPQDGVPLEPVIIQSVTIQSAG